LSKALLANKINLPAETITQSVNAKGKVKTKVTKEKYTGMDIAAGIMGYGSTDQLMRSLIKMLLA